MKFNNKNDKKIIISIIVFLIITTFFLLYQATFLKLSYDFEAFFPKKSTITKDYYAHREKFEPDNDFILLSVSDSVSIYDKSFLKKVQGLTSSIEKLDDVNIVNSVTNYSHFVKAPFLGTYFDIPLYSKDSLNSSLLIADSLILRSNLISNDFKSTSLFIKTTPYLSKNKSDILANEIHELLHEFSFKHIALAGRSVGQIHYINIMQNELILFMSISLLLVVIIIWRVFNSFSNVLISVLILSLSLIWTAGIISLMGKSLTILLTIMPTVVFIVGMSDIIHFISKYFECLRKGQLHLEALKSTFKQIGKATFLTSFTTAIGFITLLTASISPVREFGLFTGVSVLVTFVVSFLILYVYLFLNNKIVKKVNLQTGRQLKWDSILSKLYSFVMNNKIKLLLSFMFLGVVFVYQGSKVEVNNYLLEDLQNDDPVKQDFLFFENNYSGVRPLEIVVELSPTQKLNDIEILNDLDSIETKVKLVFEANMLTGPAFIFKYGINADKGLFGLAEKMNTLDSIKLNKLYSKLLKNNALVSVYDEKSNTVRIFGRISDYGGKEFKKREVLFFNSLALLNNKYKIYTTGTSKLIDKNNEYLVANTIQGLSIALFLIGIIVGVLFRSFRMIVIALIVNFIPLLFILGLMGFLHIDMKIATSIIFTIAFGIAVDDTIHFLSKLKQELQENDIDTALRNTFLSTGRALILTTIILFFGFISIVGSSFMATYYVGLFVSLSLLVALVSDMFLLPVLIKMFYRSNKK